MRMIAILFLILAGCTAAPVVTGPVVSQSALVSQSSFGTTVVARAMTIATPAGPSWILRLTVADAARVSEQTAVYALGAPMPFIVDGNGTGYIPMSRGIFEALAKSGFRAELVDGARLLPIDVPGQAFTQVLQGQAH